MPILDIVSLPLFLMENSFVKVFIVITSFINLLIGWKFLVTFSKRGRMILVGIPLILSLLMIGKYIVYQESCLFLEKKKCLSISTFHFVRAYVLFVNTQGCFVQVRSCRNSI